MNTVVVEVRGGIVVDVYAKSPVTVVVVDHDNPSREEFQSSAPQENDELLSMYQEVDDSLF